MDRQNAAVGLNPFHDLEDVVIREHHSPFGIGREHLEGIDSPFHQLGNQPAGMGHVGLEQDGVQAEIHRRIPFSLGQKREKVDWTVDFAMPFLLGVPDDAGAPPPQGGLGLGANYFGANKRSRNSIMVFPKQAFVRLHHLGPGKNHSLRLGRFDYMEGNEITPKSATLNVLKRTRIQQQE